MEIFAISGLINFIVSLYISVFVFIKGRKQLANKFFILMSCSVAMWSFGYWRWLLETLDYDKALFWLKFLSVGSIWVPIFLFLWIIFQFKDLVKNKVNKILSWVYPILGIIFTLLSFTSLFVESVEQKLFFVFWPNPGPFYIYYVILCYASLTIYTSIILLKAYNRSYGQVKNQLKYVILGSVIAIIGGFSNFPLWYDINLIPYGNFLVGVYPIVFTYAFIKYRLMDIRLVITKSILYFILILSVALSFTFVTFLTAQFFKGEGQVWVTLIVSLIIVIGLDPLKKLLARWTDKFFYKGKINYQKILRGVGEIIAREIDLENLLKALEFNLQSKLKVKTIKIYLLSNNAESNYLYKNDIEEDKISNNSSIVSYLKNKKQVVVTEEMARFKADANTDEKRKEYEDLEQALDNKKVGLAVPIIAEGELTGFFLVSQKLSGGVFTQADFDFFDVIGPQTATALEKSKLYEEVQEFNIGLQDKVKQAALELEERNRYLIALQKLTNVITRSLDFEKVMQTIADGVTHQLGFVGGLLNFIDFEKKHISIGAISNTPQIKDVIKLLPKNPKEYIVSLSNEDNLAVRAIHTKELQSSNNFWDFVKPTMSEELANKIQGILNIQCVVAVPVYSEERVIGVIDFVLAKDCKEITNVEKEMMYALSDQAGIVYRNLTYYEQVQKANKDLKHANIRLQKLDKAKSEFLSIASHQLRTPLTGIKGYLSMISEGDFGEVPPKIAKVVDEVFVNSDRLTRLVNTFLNVSRIESGRFTIEKKNIDLVNLVDSVVTNFIPTASKRNLELSLIKPKKLIPAVGIDNDKIKDVIINLVDNAIKYTPEGNIEVHIEQVGDEVKVSVKDTGVGILKSEAKELFKKFVRGVGIAQIDTSGSGLGLYIAKKIIEAHDGKIWAESEGKGKGAIFGFNLPLK